MIINEKIEVSALTAIAENHSAVKDVVLSACSIDAIPIASSTLNSISIEP